MTGDAAPLLATAGHDVQTALAEQLGGRGDPRVIEACRNESRILVTFDLDFADIRTYPPSEYPGICVLRPAAQSVRQTLTLLRGAIQLLEQEPARNRLWIVESNRVRIHD